MLLPGKPALVLAPMEGVTDAPMRSLFAELGAFDLAVSEFIRVNHEPVSAKVLLKHIPELSKGSRTVQGLPVSVQLLGGNPERLAESAVIAVELGALAIDLNFGCPAPTVNRHDGGATLLKYPSRLGGIVAAVRKAVPAQIPVSAKLRLGWDCIDSIDENAAQAADAGASWITIHGRTKAQGYTKPAYWEPIGRVQRRLKIPVIANGEIMTLEDFRRCREVTGCEHFMLGRGAMGNPWLPFEIAREMGKQIALPNAKTWSDFLDRFIAHSAPFPQASPNYNLRRIKQWLSFAQKTGGIDWFDGVKRSSTLEEILLNVRIATGIA